MRTPFLGWWAAATLLGAALIAAINWLVDPLQFYRRAGYAPVFVENQRYQNPGLARSLDYETVVVGTSHAENFLPSEVERRLGERAVKLAIAGSTAREQRLVLEVAIATGRVEHVLWILDRVAFSRPPAAVGSGGEAFPMHLYREGPRTPLLYLLSTDTLRLSAAALLGLGHRDLDTLNAWHADHAFGPQPVLADWRRRMAVHARLRSRPGMGFRDRTAQIARSIEANVASLARAHPQIRFDLVFPPYSILSPLADFGNHPRAFAARQRYKAALVEAVADLPHVRVLDLQGLRAVTHDLSRYKDLEHFDLGVTRLVLDAVAAGRYVVDPATYADDLAEQAQEVERYRAEVCAPGSPRRALCPPFGLLP